MSTSNISGSPHLPQEINPPKKTAVDALVFNLRKGLDSGNDSKVKSLVEAAINSKQLSSVLAQLNISTALLKKIDLTNSNDVTKFLTAWDKENNKAETASKSIPIPSATSKQSGWKKGILRSNTAATSKVNTVAQQTVSPIAQKSGKDEFIEGMTQLPRAFLERDITKFDKAINTILSAVKKPDEDWGDDEKENEIYYIKEYLESIANPENYSDKDFSETSEELLKPFQKSAQNALSKLGENY